MAQTETEDTLLYESLEEIVISDQSSDILIEAATYSLNLITQGVGNNYLTTTDYIREAPGVYDDRSLGEAYSRVFTRGVSASAEDDIGWYYNGLYKNSMPVTAIQYQYFTPDLFLRPGLHTSQLEVIRGGKSSVLFQNAPGGVFNFISLPPFTEKKTIETTFGILGKGNPYYKIEGLVHENLGAGWALSGSAMYRYSRGHHEVDHPWDKGGQAKAMITKISGSHKWSLHASFLDDKIDRYTGLVAVNWNDPTPAFGQDFNNTALMLPGFQSTVPGPAGYTFNPEKGIAIRDLFFQDNHTWKKDKWRFSTDVKYSNKNVDWQTSFGNNPLHLSDFLTYFISGDAFPAGIVTFEDTKSGELLATVNNTEAFNVFQGLPPGFEACLTMP